MSNVVEQLTPNPVTHEHGENGCCKNPREWEMEMMHQVWAAGLHDALETKWKLESQGKGKPKTNGDRIRAMTDEELAGKAAKYITCQYCPIYYCVGCEPDECAKELFTWLRSPVEK